MSTRNEVVDDVDVNRTNEPENENVNRMEPENVNTLVEQTCTKYIQNEDVDDMEVNSLADAVRAGADDVDESFLVDRMVDSTSMDASSIIDSLISSMMDEDSFSISDEHSTTLSQVESICTSDNDDSTFLKGDSCFDSMNHSNSSNDNSDNQLDQLILPILGEHLNILQKSTFAIPTIIKIISQSKNEVVGKWGRSPSGKRANKERNFEFAYERIMKDYFSAEQSTYNEQDFERRFRLPRNVFDTIYDRIIGKSIFIQGIDATKKRGIHPLCRFVACIRYLAYGGSFDSLDEYCRLSESSIHKSVKCFTKIIIEEFGEEFLNRSPSDDESKEILNYNETRGFPGMFASWDCTHFNWKKCPTALHGQFKGRKECKTLVLEAVVDCNLRFWFINFGKPGSLSDLNVLHQSSIVRKLLSHNFNIKTKPYTINHTVRDYMYFFCRWDLPTMVDICTNN